MNNRFNIKLDNEIYSESVVFKALYWLAGNYKFDISKDKKYFNIEIEKINGSFDNGEITNLKVKISRSLVDMKTREIVINETKNIRDIMMLKAFFHFDELDKEELIYLLDKK